MEVLQRLGSDHPDPVRRDTYRMDAGALELLAYPAADSG